MERIVCKFGGSSAANSDGFKRIRHILSSNPARRCVVLSAPGAMGGREKLTDLLEQVWRDGGAGDALDEAAARFSKIARGLGLPDETATVREVLLRSAAISRAHTLSRGEYLSARLFARWTGLPFVDAAHLLCFDAGGALSVPESLRAIREAARQHIKMVVPGFYGSDPKGNIVILPRNGSDITGALVAAGVGASLYENWTDVPGLMTADPAVDPAASVIPEITYAEMRRRAERGARVLHPDCLGPLEALGIPTRIKCTLEPDAPGTLVR